MTSQSKNDKNASHDAASRMRRRRVVVMLVLLLGGGYGCPRWFLQYQRVLNATPSMTASQVYDKYQGKARWIQRIHKVPGHRTAASTAMYDLRSRTILQLKELSKRNDKGAKQKALAHLMYVYPKGFRRSANTQAALCQERQFSLFMAMRHPEQSLRWLETFVRHLKVGALQRGHTALLSSIETQNKRKARARSWLQEREESGLAQLLAGRPDLAAKRWQLPKDKRHKRHRYRLLKQALCSVYAIQGKDQKAARASQDRRCRAIRAWQRLRRGQHDEALALLPSWEAPLDDALFLTRTAALAQAGRWFALEQLWRRANWRKASRLLSQSDVFSLLNPLDTHRIPPSLLAGLQTRVEQHLQQASAFGPGIARLLTWLLVRRGRQALLLGQPSVAIRRLRRALERAPHAHGAQVSLVTILGLVKGPKAARAQIAQFTASSRIEKHKRQWAYFDAIYAARMGLWKQMHNKLKQAQCHVLGDTPQAICRLLQAQWKRKQAGHKANKTIDYAEPDPLIRLLHTPPTLRTRERINRTLRYIHPGLPSPGLRARLLLMQFMDPKGTLAARHIAAWHCPLQKLTVSGSLLTTYLLEQLAQRHRWPQRKQLKEQRQKLGQLYRKAAEYWLPNLGM